MGNILKCYAQPTKLIVIDRGGSYRPLEGKLDSVEYIDLNDLVDPTDVKSQADCIIIEFPSSAKFDEVANDHALRLCKQNPDHRIVIDECFSYSAKFLTELASLRTDNLYIGMCDEDIPSNIHYDIKLELACVHHP